MDRWSRTTILRLGSRLLVTAGLVVAMAIGTAGAAVAQTEPPPGRPLVPPIVGSFKVTPDSGPVGSTVSIHGFCGFRASAFVAVLARGPIGEGAGVAHVLKPATFLKSTPFGHFSTKVQIPAVGSVDGEPITPGGYFVRVGCFPGTPVVILPEQLFEVTASQRGGGPGR